MAKSYCIAGAVVEKGVVRVVRPLIGRGRDAPVRNMGWSAYQMDGHTRWEIFELVGADPALPEPPHVEDLWVRELRSLRRLATPEQRRAILAATAIAGQPPFGAPFETTRSAAFLKLGTGQRSLATLLVSASQLRFDASWRVGAPEPDYRVELPLPDVGMRALPLKDHHLLLRAEKASPDLQIQVTTLTAAVKQMGETVAVRLGLSRSFQARSDQEPGPCWLMADGFFSLQDPQP